MTFDEWSNRKKKKKNEWVSIPNEPNEDDIAPIVSTPKVSRNLSRDTEETKSKGLLAKGTLSDGYQVGDIILGGLASVGDVVSQFSESVGNVAEGVYDLGVQGVALGADLIGEDDFADKARKHAEKDYVSDSQAELRYALGIEDASFLGDFSRNVVQGLGQVAVTIGTGGIAGALGASGAVASAITTGMMGATSMGSGITEAYEGGATDGEAWAYGSMKGVVDASTELIFGGLGKGVKVLGVGKGLTSVDDMVAKTLSSKISSTFWSNATELGVKASAEGLEEVLAGIGNIAAKKLTYMSEEEIGQLLEDENLLEQFAIGAITSGIAQGGDFISSTSQGRDMITDLSTNEESVVKAEYEERLAEEEKNGNKLTGKQKNELYERVVEDLKKGYISTDTIERTLGGLKYEEYQNTVAEEESAINDLKDLYEGDELTAQIQKLKENSKIGKAQADLSDFVQKSLSQQKGNKTLTDSYLVESYNERARRGQDFKADLSQYDEKYKATIQKAIDSGILNNTRRTHELVDMIAKISADKGVSFDFTSNEKLAQSSFAVNGRTVNGYVAEDGSVTLNVESAKSLDKVVGHEIAHVLEDTDLYDTLQEIAFAYASTRKATDSKFKNEYHERLYNARELYKDVKGYEGVEGFKAIKKEVVADLVGDYLFTDPDFVKHLSTKNRNVFEKMYDEIKYLCKVATAGSKEARQLEKVKRAFEEAYRADSKASTEAKTEDVTEAQKRFSISVTDKKTIDFLENQEHITTYKAMQLIDGKLYPPMAAKVKGEDGKYHLNNPSELGKWQQATEDPTNIKKFKNGVGYYTLNKGNGKSIDAAYNPYEHSSNLVLNDQFEEAYNRDNIVTVECEIPVSEMTSGYKAEHAKDGTGVMDWKSGVVAGKIKDNKRKVYLSRYLKPVRILSDAETAVKYKEVVGDVSVPFNVVTPSLLAELEKAGVNIDYDGSPMYKSIQRRKAAKGETKYSLSDSDGKKLTKEQREFFKDSKVRDENGNLKVMYHGTPNGDFTVFKDGTYFTETKAYADVYQDPNASMLRPNKGVSSPKTFEVYLDIKKPFDISDKEARSIYINEYIKGGNAVGINPYLTDAEYDKIKTVDWVEGEDLREFLIDNGYDYDGLVLDEGAVGGYGDDVISRGKSYVVFSPEQVKNVDNKKPTKNPDIRFSLSKPVEETPNLIAAHNLSSDNLLKSLELGGLPMPSVAITRADGVHNDYGDISLILRKSAIDPKANKENKIYSGDAWTPVYPTIEFKPNDKVVRKINEKYYELARKYGSDDVRPLYRFAYDTEDALKRDKGEQGLIKALYDDTKMMQVYLLDTGKGKVETVQKEIRTELSDAEVTMNEFFINELGFDVVNSIMAQNGENPALHKKQYWIDHGAKIQEAYKKFLSEEYSFTESEIENVLENTRTYDYLRFVRDAYLYRKNGRVTIKTEADISATDEAIRKAATDGYKEWVDSLFKGIEEKTGIRNNRDYFTPSGNRRSWDALHWENTLENVVRVMKAQGNGENTFFTGHGIWGAAANEYKSIEEVKADSDRLKRLPKEEYEAIRGNIGTRLQNVAERIMSKSERNQFIAADNALACIVDAVRNSKTKSGILNELKQYQQLTVTEADAAEIVSIVADIAKMPTEYFEAKPQRAVGFDEIGVFVIPRNADVKLKQELLNKGYSIAEYDPDVEGDRQKVVNSFEEYKFSLSKVGEQPDRFGRYNSKDIMLEKAPTEDIAPVGEVVAENATTTEAPVPEAEQVGEDIIPNDLPISEEIANAMPNLEADLQKLYQEQKDLESEITKGMAANENTDSLVTRYGEVIAEIERLEKENTANHNEALNSLNENDMPPEIEAPYYGEEEAATPDNPFKDRDIETVGNRKVKAYMYENPEVKPFFQEEAAILGGELDRTDKAETYYNGRLKYEMSYEAAQDIPEVYRTKRRTSPDIAYLLDTVGLSYDEIEKGINAIIEDHGAENIAAAKKIEFILNDRLMYGYKDADLGFDVPPNQDYINLLKEKQITEYNEEARKHFFENADDYAPIAPVAEAEIAPTKESEAIKPKPEAPTNEEAQWAKNKMARADNTESESKGKRRKFVKSSIESDAVDGHLLQEDLDQDKIFYQPISNKATLNDANTRLGSMGYEASVAYFNSQFANKKTTVEDIVLGERLIQEAIKRGDTKTAGELIEDVAILGTELGQKVQALSIIKRLTPEGQLRMLQRTVERGKTKGDKAFDGVEITQDMIDKILGAYNKASNEDVAKLQEEIARLDGTKLTRTDAFWVSGDTFKHKAKLKELGFKWSKDKQAWYMADVSNTFDQEKLNATVEDVKQEIANKMKVSVMEKANAWRYLSMLGNPKTHLRNFVSNVAMRGTTAVKDVVARTVETVAPIKNRTKTWKPATEDVKTFAKNTAVEMKDVLQDGGKYNEEASIKAKRAIFKNKVLNGVYELNSNLLSKEDWWFSKPVFTKALSEYLTANGISTKEDIANNPKIVEKAKQYATEQSQIATFRQYSWLANKINEIERHNGVTGMAVGAVLPFKKTPINIAKTALNYSPLGFAKTLTYDAIQVKKGKMEASTLVDHLAQNVTGSALTLVGYMLATAGFLNGGGEDDKEGEYDYQLGEQAYSVNIGGASFSLSWLSPIAMPLFVGANAYEQLVEGKEWNGDVVIETLAQTLDPLSEMSFLSSLDSVLSSYDSGIEKFAGIGQSMVQNYITQYVPTLSSQVAATIDDTKRTTKVAGDSDFRFVDETINNLKYKIPFLRQTLEPTTDIWGNDVKQSENILTRAIESFLAPYAKREDIATEVDAEIKALYSETGDDGLIPSIPNNYVNYKNEKYKMSAEEYTAYKETYGQTAFGLLQELFNTDTYYYASAEDRADMVNKVYDYARDTAKEEFLAKRNVGYTNASSNGQDYYNENPIYGAIRNDLTIDEYSFSEKYPEKYTVAKAMGGYDTYKSFASDLYDIKADKDSNGKSISGSRKRKVVDYINGLNADYGEKLIMFKSVYNADDTYNSAIVEYLNSREDISYSEMETILKELGFTVSADGNISW